MIFVTLKRKNNNLVGFSIKGHADFAEEGSDIVCSAVSILAYSTVNTLDLYLNDLDFIDDGNVMTLLIENSTEETDVIFKFFETGIQTLLGNYNKYVNLDYEEV
ncbi:MAG: ribosomal-processing cysteine protease Prp [Peptoniphilaceae bacterium]|nr:ribosomal-processing cysteine protease Prp [Peptoniphilaceae bacterium]MDY6019592.1 ribosomal-processing cysteine protease Prp [Anaerococcus sp.]